MNYPSPEQVQLWIEHIEQTNKNYIHIAVKYIGRDDAVYDKAREDAINLAKIAGYLTYFKESLEFKNELLD